MAEHGSYVEWCIETIQGFKIEPSSLHSVFMQSYKEYKDSGYKGVIVHCSYKPVLPLGVPQMERALKSHLDNMILGEYL